jgi:hypothetical protein
MGSSLGRIGFLGWVCLATALACGGEPGTADDAEEVGQVELQLAQVPAGIVCVELTLDGSTQLTKRFSVVSGQSAALSLAPVRPGQVTLGGNAFNVACASVTTATAPLWVAEPTNLVATAGVVTPARLTFVKPATLSVTADFQTSATVTCGGASCAMGAKFCCALTDKQTQSCLDTGLSCGAGPDPASPNTGMSVTCDDAADCGAGKICCYRIGRGNSVVDCEAAADCVINPAQMVSAAPVCQSNSASTPCASGTCTGSVAGVPGWKYCE